jgi:hypothetical protein
MNDGQVSLQAILVRTRGPKPEEATGNPAAEIQANRLHVPYDLGLGFFQREIDTALAALAGSMDGMGYE